MGWGLADWQWGGKTDSLEAGGAEILGAWRSGEAGLETG